MKIISVLTIRYNSNKLHAFRTWISIFVRFACTRNPPITKGITNSTMLIVSQILVGIIGKLKRMFGKMMLHVHLSER